MAVAAPAFATTGADALTVSVSQNDGVHVTVTSNGTAAENATVSVSALNNSTYAGAGNHTTDENGTIALPTPANNTTVHIVAMKGNQSAETTVTLVASSFEDTNTSDGAFGRQVSSFVGRLLSGENVRHPGRVISSWVTAHNPGTGSKADHTNEHSHAADHHGNQSGHATGQDDHPGHTGGHGNGADDHPVRPTVEITERAPRRKRATERTTNNRLFAGHRLNPE